MTERYFLVNLYHRQAFDYCVWADSPEDAIEIAKSYATMNGWDGDLEETHITIRELE